MGRDERFGRPGDAPTEFESELLERCELLDDLWVAVGKRIGARALFELMDELGGMIVSVPKRESFVHRLYVPVRDAEILAMSKAQLTDVEIAKRLGMHKTAVGRARSRALRTRRRVGW